MFVPRSSRIWGVNSKPCIIKDRVLQDHVLRGPPVHENLLLGTRSITTSKYIMKCKFLVKIHSHMHADLLAIAIYIAYALWSMAKKNLNTPWALYQLNVMVFWTLGMPVVNKFPPKNFLKKLKIFSNNKLFMSKF